jgi:3-dehydroquinate synthase class II
MVTNLSSFSPPYNKKHLLRKRLVLTGDWVIIGYENIIADMTIDEDEREVFSSIYDGAVA